MCTTITVNKNGLYFGRNMDIECSFGERILYTPRHFLLNCRHLTDREGYAVLGIGTVIDGFPMYADGVNEKGLCMAGLNFVNNAVYGKPRDNALNLAPYELIPVILRKCKDVREARELVSQLNIVDTPINSETPLPYLHFHIADNHSSIVLEPTEDGVKVYEDPVGILTNNPPFPYHLSRLTAYEYLKNRTLPATFYKEQLYTLGLGAYGLPGDYSSPSRFIKGEYLLKSISVSSGEEIASVFHILGALAVPKGAVLNNEGKYHYTLYSCCINGTKGEYHVRKYGDVQPSSVFLRDFDFDGDTLAEASFS